MDGDKGRYSLTVTVQENEIDELGHVNNTHYLRYAEEIARAHSEAHGLSLAAFKALGVVPVVRRHTITYFESAVLGDVITVQTQVEAFLGARAGRTTRLTRHDEVLLAEVATEWVWVNAGSGRPTRAPKVVLEAFGISKAPLKLELDL